MHVAPRIVRKPTNEDAVIAAVERELWKSSGKKHVLIRTSPIEDHWNVSWAPVACVPLLQTICSWGSLPLFLLEQEFNLVFYMSSLCFFGCELCYRWGVLEFYVSVTGDHFLCYYFRSSSCADAVLRMIASKRCRWAFVKQHSVDRRSMFSSWGLWLNIILTTRRPWVDHLYFMPFDGDV